MSKKTELIQYFNFEGASMKTVNLDDEVWFLGKNIAEILGYKNPSREVNKYVEIEDKKTLMYKASTKMVKALWSGEDYSDKTLINESGLYSLIMSSRLDKAKRFKRWVTSEVLPSIRKTGTYMTDSAIDKILEDPDSFIKVLNRYKKEKEQRLLAQQQVKELQPKATYYDLILQNKSLLSVTQIAKDYGMSAKKLNSLLNEFKVQFKQGKTWILYAKYQDKGYTQTATYAVDSEYSKPLTKWTQKGRLFLYDLLKNHGIVPKIEQEQAS